MKTCCRAKPPPKRKRRKPSRTSWPSCLKSNVAEVLAKLPELDLAAIEHLGGLEQTGQQRKGILGAIAERLLAEASKNEAAACESEQLYRAI